VQKKIGFAWSGRGRPPAGYFTKRQAEDWLGEVLHEARRGTLAGMVPSGVTFADAAAEWLRFIGEDRERKPSTLVDYRSALKAHLVPSVWRPAARVDYCGGDRAVAALADRPVESQQEQAADPAARLFRRAQIVWNVAVNPLARVEKHPMRPSGDIQVFSPEEVWALVRVAASEQDGTLFLTAAFTGLRMGELLALRWRDVDFGGSTMRVRASYAGAALTTPKSGRVRAVPMAPDVASAIAQLARREHWTGDDDLVFAGETGGHLRSELASNMEVRSERDFRARVPRSFAGRRHTRAQASRRSQAVAARRMSRARTRGHSLSARRARSGNDHPALRGAV
jgi:integrase